MSDEDRKDEEVKGNHVTKKLLAMRSSSFRRTFGDREDKLLGVTGGGVTEVTELLQINVSVTVLVKLCHHRPKLLPCRLGFERCLG
ncbi:hypothetical protein SESBI_07916 [Sesbania bispinosa]|nr:hypothetical protein SESBI_07916 [Sesbania bispinosa]